MPEHRGLRRRLFPVSRFRRFIILVVRTPERNLQPSGKSSGVLPDFRETAVIGHVEPGSVGFHQIEFVTVIRASPVSLALLFDNLQRGNLLERKSVAQTFHFARSRIAPVSPVVSSFEVEHRPAAACET